MKLAKAISADRVGGVIWVVFGVAVVYGAWIMDRLQSLGIPPATAPGVVPGLLGVSFIIFGLILLLRREAAAKAAPARLFEVLPADATVGASAPSAHRDEYHWKRVALSWALCMTYAGVFLARGLHYWVVTAAFLLLHMLLLDETDRVPARPTRRRLLTVALIVPAVATAVTLVFERIFLVRLP